MWSVCGGDLTCGRRSSARNRIGGASRPQVQHASGGRRRPLLGLLLGLLAAIASHAGGRSTADGATREPVWTADHQAHRTHARGFRQVTLSGYSIGLGFPPGWGEPHVLSLKPNVHTVLDENMTLHIVPSLHIPGMTIFGLSETVRVTATGCEVIGDAVPVPRRLVIKPV
jgi:Xaa-Pro aminopeptidase